MQVAAVSTMLKTEAEEGSPVLKHLEPQGVCAGSLKKAFTAALKRNTESQALRIVERQAQDEQAREPDLQCCRGIDRGDLGVRPDALDQRRMQRV